MLPTGNECLHGSNPASSMAVVVRTPGGETTENAPESCGTNKGAAGALSVTRAPPPGEPGPIHDGSHVTIWGPSRAAPHAELERPGVPRAGRAGSLGLGRFSGSDRPPHYRRPSRVGHPTERSTKGKSPNGHEDPHPTSEDKYQNPETAERVRRPNREDRNGDE